MLMQQVLYLFPPTYPKTCIFVENLLRYGKNFVRIQGLSIHDWYNLRTMSLILGCVSQMAVIT